MIRTITLSLTVCISLLLFCGCQESVSQSTDSDTALIQRARLVGTENLKLKQELEQKNEQITQLEAKIEQLEVEKTEAIRQSGDTNIKIMKIMAETEERNQKLAQENEQLKAELEKLKGQ